MSTIKKKKTQQQQQKTKPEGSSGKKIILKFLRVVYIHSLTKQIQE